MRSNAHLRVHTHRHTQFGHVFHHSSASNSRLSLVIYLVFKGNPSFEIFMNYILWTLYCADNVKHFLWQWKKENSLDEYSATDVWIIGTNIMWENSRNSQHWEKHLETSNILSMYTVTRNYLRCLVQVFGIIGSFYWGIYHAEAA